MSLLVDDALGLGESHADGLGDAEFWHGDAEEDITASHGTLIVSDDDELAMVDELVEHIEEARDIGFIEGGVEFV